MIRGSKANPSGTTCHRFPSGPSRVPMGAVGVDPTRRQLCHVLLDAGDDSARMSGQDASGGMRQDHQRGVERNVHLAGHQRQPRRSLRRRLVVRLRCPLSQGGAIDPSVFVAPTARRGCSGRATGTAATCPPRSIPSNSRPTGSRWSVRRTGSSGRPELGGESRRGSVDDPERQHLLALLLANCGEPTTTASVWRAAPPSSAPAPNRSIMRGSRRRRLGDRATRGPEGRSSSK